MSNARSPREVCSTTIGTSGLTVLASFRVRRLSPARRTLACGSGGLGGLREEVERLAIGQFGLERVQPVGGLHPLQELLGARALLLRGLLERGEDLLLAGLDPLGRDDRGEHGLALELALGVVPAVGDDLLLAAAGDLEVHLLADPLVREGVQHLVPELAGPRLDERLGDLDRGVRDRGVERRLAELRLDALARGLREPLAD